MDILAGKGVMDTIRYTKLKREDAYECIRELIDEIDTLQHIMFMFAFDRRLIDDEIAGLKSYQALWMRIQNEIVSDMFNLFTDIIDMDSLGKRIYNHEAMLDMSARLATIMTRLNQNARPIDQKLAETLLNDDLHSIIALPRQICLSTLNPAEPVESNESTTTEPGGDDYGF